MNRLIRFVTTVAAFSLLALTGCDFSANGDLRDADKLLKEADKIHADQWAEPEYTKAQQLLVEAMDLAKVNAVNEARDKALESKSWAQQAIDLTRTRASAMELEKDKLGGYKP